MDYGVGDFIECVTEDVLPTGQRVLPKNVYRCTAIKPIQPAERGIGWACSIHGDDCAGDGVHVSGVPSDHRYYFCSLCFKPIYKPRGSWSDWVKNTQPRQDAAKIKALSKPPGVPVGTPS